jgi:hypothetical protein
MFLNYVDSGLQKIKNLMEYAPMPITPQQTVKNLCDFLKILLVPENGVVLKEKKEILHVRKLT